MPGVHKQESETAGPSDTVPGIVPAHSEAGSLASD